MLNICFFKKFGDITNIKIKYAVLESGKRDSNSQHPPWRGGTLPIELLPQFGGESRIRTYGPLFTNDGFQDHCNSPLCHLT